ncbi:acetoacetate--CoA ligase [Ornithinibacillus bavariensis]|uniref:Acetoacetyl-CoA synthetase n=1 Tax=Ornithinibacillus bavariensis TaxID=545502 RepID=A0A919X773_9BACI|nr:acetoacetate--CoA ligase [Ornithinibacillus bavariensis]GIO27227.1 acetoacetyl-CoA synthetase [Ornithinibacillus bavariensis]
MKQVEEGSLLWEPSQERINQANISTFMNWLKENKGLQFKDYQSLWNWSVNEIEDFWKTIWEYFNIQSPNGYTNVLSTHQMPGAKWFENAKVNYIEHIFRNYKKEKTAIFHTSELRPELSEISWEKVYQDTAALQQTLKDLGVQKGDRVVAFIPNIYESVIALFATASLGAIWSSASPDFGKQSVIDRFKQIEPKVMITVDGYQYGGKVFDRFNVVKEIQSELDTLEATIVIPYINGAHPFTGLKNVIQWKNATSYTNQELCFELVEFNDPLWILFSSGTTGKPKPIVHSQGGILLEHLKALTFHTDLHEDDRFFWFTTTGWMMWNYLVGGLLTGSSIILYDGNPAYPDLTMLWRLAEKSKMTVFGTSASYITSCMKEGLDPSSRFDLTQLKSISSTGSPLPPEGFKWCYDHVKKDLSIASISGGTDVCTAFILGVPTLPVYAGELQCRGLGAKVESFDESGHSIINEVGELVLTEPFPSMPIYFWNDDDGTRMQDSYFDMYKGIWRHGDYIKITERGSCVIYGRSDATINRGGIRIGTSEIYRAVDHVKEIADSLIVDIPLENGESYVPLFVVMNDGKELTEEIIDIVKNQIRTQCSPRHVPTEIISVEDLPKTLNGKKIEIPVKKILMGKPIEQVANKGSLSNPKSLHYFEQFAKEKLRK